MDTHQRAKPVKKANLKKKPERTPEQKPLTKDEAAFLKSVNPALLNDKKAPDFLRSMDAALDQLAAIGLSDEQTQATIEILNPVYRRIPGSVDILKPTSKQLAASKKRIDAIQAETLSGDMAGNLQQTLDRVFQQHGISTAEAKREVLARLYQEPATSPEAAILRSAPPSLQPNARGRTFDKETIKAATQVMNRYKYQKRRGRGDFSNEERDAIRAAGRVLATLRRKSSTPEA